MEVGLRAAVTRRAASGREREARPEPRRGGDAAAERPRGGGRWDAAVAATQRGALAALPKAFREDVSRLLFDIKDLDCSLIEASAWDSLLDLPNCLIRLQALKWLRQVGWRGRPNVTATVKQVLRRCVEGLRLEISERARRGLLPPPPHGPGLPPPGGARFGPGPGLPLPPLRHGPPGMLPPPPLHSLTRHNSISERSARPSLDPRSDPRDSRDRARDRDRDVRGGRELDRDRYGSGIKRSRSSSPERRPAKAVRGDERGGGGGVLTPEFRARMRTYLQSIRHLDLQGVSDSTFEGLARLPDDKARMDVLHKCSGAQWFNTRPGAETQERLREILDRAMRAALGGGGGSGGGSSHRHR